MRHPGAPGRRLAGESAGRPAGEAVASGGIESSALIAILSALGLSGASGLNAWLPLLLTGGLERVGWVQLDPAWAQLGDTPVLLVLGALFLLDFVADKVPIVDHALHAAGVVVHPAAGAVLFDAQAGSDVSFLVSLLIGGGSAGILHGARATARPAVSGATVGVGAPVMSILEDIAAFLLVLVAFLIPVVAGLVVIVLIVGAVLAARQMRRLIKRRGGRGDDQLAQSAGRDVAGPGERRGPRAR